MRVHSFPLLFHCRLDESRRHGRLICIMESHPIIGSSSADDLMREYADASEELHGMEGAAKGVRYFTSIVYLFISSLYLLTVSLANVFPFFTTSFAIVLHVSQSFFDACFPQQVNPFEKNARCLCRSPFLSLKRAVVSRPFRHRKECPAPSQKCYQRVHSIPQYAPHGKAHRDESPADPFQFFRSFLLLVPQLIDDSLSFRILSVSQGTRRLANKTHSLTQAISM